MPLDVDLYSASAYEHGNSIISSMIDKMALAKKDHSINLLDFSDINLVDNESCPVFRCAILPTELKHALRNTHVTSINFTGAKLDDYFWGKIVNAIKGTYVISINFHNIYDSYLDKICRIQIEDQIIKNKIQFTKLICKNFEEKIGLQFDLAYLVCSYLECSDLTNLFRSLQIDGSHEPEAHLSGEISQIVIEGIT